MQNKYGYILDSSPLSVYLKRHRCRKCSEGGCFMNTTLYISILGYHLSWVIQLNLITLICYPVLLTRCQNPYHLCFASNWPLLFWEKEILLLLFFFFQQRKWLVQDSDPQPLAHFDLAVSVVCVIVKILCYGTFITMVFFRFKKCTVLANSQVLLALCTPVTWT